MYNEKVSVIIPTFKRSDMLPRAINSVLNQSYNNYEVVVVDDNNPDTEWRKETTRKMEKYKEDNRVKYICHEKNINGSAARNTGIRKATGTIVAFLDDDDIYTTYKLEKQVHYLLKNPEYRAVYCGWERENKIFIPRKEGNLSYDILSGDNIIYTNAIMMWKKDAIECGGWDETFRRHQEAAFLMRFFENGGKIGCISESLVIFDTSDRSNCAGNPKINEEQTLHYLSTFSNYIKTMKKSDKKKILLHRYRGIFLAYLKNRDFDGAFGFFIRKCCVFPVSFIGCMLSYSVHRLGINSDK